ncbi:MAG: ATP-grasp domain-containing protein [Treponema sp.]|jgi:biotin carboxylase|nr:ATP-grasp domain-containing protein [Treponema sp.]
MKERLIILGAGVMQGPVIRIAKELGFFTVVLDGSSNAPCVSLADRFEQIDLKDREGIENFARSLQNSGGLGGIMTAGTDFSASVAWAAERLGLPGIPYEAALNASDKSRMRNCFKKAALPSPEFVTISAARDLETLSLPGGQNRQAPLVIKPVDNMGGRGCRRADSQAELREAAADALRFSRSGRAIVESFIEGPEFSVDAIVYHGEIIICGLADRHIFFPPYFIEMGHTMPTAIAPEKQEVLLETFRAGIRALGLAGRESAGAAKGDIKLSPQGPMIGEIAARLSGGYMSGWTYPYSSGIEPIRAAILVAAGRRPENLAPLKTWTSAERAFISIPGTVKSISGIDAARNQSGVKDLFLRIAEGSGVSFPENNVTKCGNIISAAPERLSAVESAETAARSILIRLDPSDTETAAFLSAFESGPNAAGPAFPPDAFQLDAELRAAFSRLPEFPPSGDHNPPVYLIPFPEFTASKLTDYAGRTVKESLEAVRNLSGLSLPEILPETGKVSDNKRRPLKTRPEFLEAPAALLGRSFWAALIRGGYQGAVYYIDRQVSGE